MPKGPKGRHPPIEWPPSLDQWRDRPLRQRRNAGEKRASTAAAVQLFTRQYARKAQKGVEPNDRRFERKTEERVKRMKPEELDRLLRDGEE